MNKLLGQSVHVAFRALGDLVEPCQVVLREDVEFNWLDVVPTERNTVQQASVVFVDEKLQNPRGYEKKLWALVKFEKSIPPFSQIVVGQKSYRCEAPVVSYRFLVMVEVHEIQ